MSILSRLFPSRKRTITLQNPLRIDSPSIGFLNLHGPVGSVLENADRQVLSPLFSETRASEDVVPQCSVLFIYCDVNTDGHIVGRKEGIRDLVKKANAYIAVVASENPPDHYMKCLDGGNGWTANIVFTLDRKGDKLPRFYADLFRRMYGGKSMLMAWVELAPQIPGHDHLDAPEGFMVAEAGHLVFCDGGKPL